MAVDITQQYIAGELSILLAQLQLVATTVRWPSSRRGYDARRRRAHFRRWPAWRRAFALDDTLCWDSLTRGDEVAFTRQARVGADPREFSVCAGLLADP